MELSWHLLELFRENLRCTRGCTSLLWLSVVLLGDPLALNSYNTKRYSHMAGVSHLSPIDSFLSQTTKGEWGKMSALCTLRVLSPLREIPTGQLNWFVALAFLALKGLQKERDVSGVGCIGISAWIGVESWSVKCIKAHIQKVNKLSFTVHWVLVVCMSFGYRSIAACRYLTQ